ncbi:hypothetical protein [Paraglaciecola arctica]|uniref:hypothetical protein n=1 Tax=Paraglaciecola arctica TaxID=1128911 RepID=UPI001C07D605|nr:hypothetical protein [Paraglaciecola arctica]MBU3002651.1 hypothetical protein [Paraglaciecola arctica]
MRTRQRRGALSAFICATSFILGLSLILIIAPDFNNGPDERLQTLTKFSGLMQLWYFFVYVIFGAFLLVLSIALLEPNKREHTPLEQVTTLASYLWACYIFTSGFIAIFSIEFLFAKRFEFTGDVTTLWRDIYAVQMGLGEGIEWVGAIWVILVNTCLYIENRFAPKIVYFGYLISVFGLMTLVENWQQVGAIFGLLQIVWFVWVGLLLLKEKSQSQ